MLEFLGRCCLERIFLDFIPISECEIRCEWSVFDVRQNIQRSSRIDSSQSIGRREKSNFRR